MLLSEFLGEVDAHLDPTSESSVRALSPALAALGANRQFLADAIEQAPQELNPYGNAIILAHNPVYVVRVVPWPARTDKVSTPLTSNHRTYDGESRAHTHSFMLLTYGCLGPGYVTDVYPCDPEELARAAIGDRVTLGPRESWQLGLGTVLFYPRDSVAHVQHPPAAYSISLNLMVKSPNPNPQYFIDPATSVLIRKRNQGEA